MNPANTPAQPATETGAKPRRAPARLPVLLATGILLTIGCHYGLDYSIGLFTHESTDDAFLDTAILRVAPQVAGSVRAVHVRDNQAVKTGDLLVEIDPRDFEAGLAQKHAASAGADANLSSAKAGLSFIQARLETAQATQRQEEATAEADRARARRAQSDLKRTENLHQTGVVSQEEYDRALADSEAAAADLRASEQKAAAAAAGVTEARAQVDLAVTMVTAALTKIGQSRADEQSAELDLSYTRITAACDGRVTRKAVEPGAYVQPGQALFALVPDRLWVTANFKETQLSGMRTNQPVHVHLDAYPGRTWRGHVDSIMAGSGARFSLLPPENAVGNFVKVVQRVPVKIVFDEPLDPAMSLGPGMSVVPEVRIRDFAPPAAAIWGVALLLGGLITLGLAWMVDHFRE